MPQCRKYRILLFGDASNYHVSLAKGLRKKGHIVTVVSNGSKWMKTDRDVDISRPFANKFGGLLLWLKLKFYLHKYFSGYDIVSIDGICFTELRPHRLASLFDSLKKRNTAVFVSSISTNSNFVKACTDIENPPFRYSEWMIEGKPGPLASANPQATYAWTSDTLSALCDKIYNESKGTVTALYEYDVVCRRFINPDKVAYGGIPIDTDNIEFRELPSHPPKVKLFLGRHRDRQLEKGSDRLYSAAKKVVEKHPDKCELELVENIPYNDYLKRMRNSHIVLDQLYSYTPATNALLAMAMGKIAVSGAEPDFYDFIGEKELHPIINAIPNDEILFNQLENLVLNTEIFPSLSRQSRLFVEKHNSLDVVAKRFLDFWNSKLSDNAPS